MKDIDRKKDRTKFVMKAIWILGIIQCCHTIVVITERECLRRMKTMNKIDWTKITNAVEVIKMGICNRCDVDGVIVYKCGTVIRIDIKGQFE